jgi:hypothetical protein
MIPGRDVTPSRRLGLSAAFIVKDSAGQKLAYVYYEEERGGPPANIAKLPERVLAQSDGPETRPNLMWPQISQKLHTR